MLITLPATCLGPLTSVLDLEPLLVFARQCRPDCVSLLPPTGPDDLPNAAGLQAIADRLLAEGLRPVGGVWTVPAAAPVTEPGWMAQASFELRALAAALGEARVQPLTLYWEPARVPGTRRDPLQELLERVADELERSELELAVGAGRTARELSALLARVGCPRIGLCRDLDAGRPSPQLRVARIRPSSLASALNGGAAAAGRALAGGGDVLAALEGFESLAAWATAVGALRGLRAAGAAAVV